MTTRAKLIALHGRMVAEQRALLVQAAEAGALPPANTLDRIGDLDAAIAAVEAMIEEG